MLKLLQKAVEQSSEGIAIIYPSGEIIFSNSSFARMHGYSPEELVGKNVSIFHTPDQVPDVERINRQLHEEGVFKGPVWHARRDGSPFLGMMHNSVVRDDEGKVIALVGILRDISVQVEADNELKRAEERFRQVASNAGEWIWEVDANGLYLYSSPAVLEMLGYEPEELVQKMHFYDLFRADLREDYRKTAFESFARKENIKNFVNQNTHKNGKFVYLETSCSPVLDAEGKLLGYRGADTNITERVEADAALRSEQLLNKEYIDSLPGLFYVFDEKRFVRWNEQWKKVSGYSSDELSKMYGPDFFEGTDRTLIENAMHKVFLEGVAGVEAEFITKDGKRIPYYFTGLRKEFDGKPYLVGLGIDITDRKKAEMELLRVKEGLEDRVWQRTEELSIKVDELERFREATINREFRIKELLNELDSLRDKLKEK